MAFAGDMVINLLGTTKGLDRALTRGAIKVKGFAGSAGGSMRGFGKSSGGVMAAFASGMKRMGSIAMRTAKVIGVALVAAIGLSISKQIEFDDAIRKAGARAEASAKGLETLRDRAKKLGLSTSFTATEIATMMEGLGQGGFAVAEIENMTESVAHLARATGTDAKASADLLASTIRTFGMEAKDASHVADVFTTTANSTLTSVEDLAEGWKFAAGAAGNTSTSMEELAAAFGTLSQGGVKGSVAGTALRRMMTLSAADAKDLSKTFGVSFKDMNDNTFSLVDQMAMVGNAINNTGGNATKLSKLYEAFGLRGVTASSLLTKNFAETDALLAKINGTTGAALDTMNKIEEGPGGKWRLFKSAVEGLRIEIGEKLAPMFSSVMTFLTEKFKAAIEWIKTDGTKWMEWFERIFTIMKVSFQFVWENAEDIFKLFIAGSLLKLTSFAEEFKYYFTDVIPAAIGWFFKNFNSLFLDAAAFVGIAMRNMVDNIIAIWNAAMDWFEKDGKFEPDLKPLSEGFEAMFRDNLVIPDRVKGLLELELEGQVKSLQESLGEELGTKVGQALTDLAAEQLERRNRELDDTQAPTFEGKPRDFSAGGGGGGSDPAQMAGVLQRGSADAFKQIFASGGVSQKQLDAQLRLEKIAAMQLAVQERADKREAARNARIGISHLLTQGAVP